MRARRGHFLPCHLTHENCDIKYLEHSPHKVKWIIEQKELVLQNVEDGSRYSIKRLKYQHEMMLEHRNVQNKRYHE
jgi:hypothetical protein